MWGDTRDWKLIVSRAFACLLSGGLLLLSPVSARAEVAHERGPRSLVDRRGILVVPGYLSSIEEFHWSPDGQQIAAAGFDRDVRGRVFVADHGTFTPITPARQEARTFGWMPDSRSLLVAFDDRRTSSLDADVHSELAVIRLDGSVIRSIPLDRELRVWYGLTVSSDGTRAVASGGAAGPASYDFDPGLIEIDLESGRTRDLVLQAGFFGYEPQFVDADSIMFYEECGECSPDDQHATILDVTTSTSRQVTPSDMEVLDLTVVVARQELLFVGLRDERPNGRKVWTMPLADGVPTSVPNSRDIQAVEAQPQGEFVLYRSYDRVTRGGEADLAVRFHLVEYPSFKPI